MLVATEEFLARDSIYAIARYMPSPVRLSVCLSVPLSVTRVDQSKTVEVRITQPSPQSPMTSFLTHNFTAKFQREDRERGRRIREGYEKCTIFSQLPVLYYDSPGGAVPRYRLR